MSFKAILIKPFEEPVQIEVFTNRDIWNALDGFMEDVHLTMPDGSDVHLLINDNGADQFEVDKDANHLATALAITGGRYDVRVLGPAIVAGKVVTEELTDVPSSAKSYLENTWQEWQKIMAGKETDGDSDIRI